MKILVVAHGADEKERWNAFDFVNCTTGGSVILFGDGKDLVVNLDRVQQLLAEVDGLILLQCTASSISNGIEESELQRVERLAATLAVEAKKTVGVIGTLETLMSKHLTKCSGDIGLVGIFQSKRDMSGALADHFKAQQIYLGDMDRGARDFMRAFLHLAYKDVEKEAAA